MPSYVPPKKNTAYVFYVSLVSQSNTKVMQANPTLATGDVKVAIDDGAPADLATLPVVDADFTKRVKVSLSSGEMNGDRITVIFFDASGAEWCDLTVDIATVARQVDELSSQVSVDDLPTNAELATSQAAADDATLAAIAALNNLSAAQVNAEVDTALADYDGPTFAELDARTDAIDAAVAILATQASVNDLPTNAELATALASADDAILAAIAALNNLSAAQVGTEVDAALADYDGPTRAELTSDIASLAAFVDTEIAAILQDTGTDIPASLAALLALIDTEVSAILSAVDTEVSAIKTVTDALTAAAAAKLALSAGVIVAGSAIAGTLSTTVMTTDLTEATDDHFNGRILIFTSGTLQFQATDITDYDGTTKALTYTAITEAPVAGDDFIIV